MRILFLSQVLPYPLDAGPKMRSYFVLRQLVQQHEVTLVTFVRDTDRPEDIAHMTGLCHAVRTVPMRRSRLQDAKFLAKSLITRQPFLILRDQVIAMTETIRQVVQAQPFDIIHADQLWMAQYALAAQKISLHSKIILDQHNATYLIPQRMAQDTTNPLKKLFLSREAQALTAYEVDVCRRFNHVVWVTQEDRQAVAAVARPSLNGHPPSTVIPICTDTNLAQPIEPSPQPHRITFLGGLHWPPNAQGVLWFAKHVFPRVRAQVPHAVLTAIGKNPPEGLEGEGIEVTGYVVDPKSYLAETAAFIVPLHAGGGMRVKILDAWSWGLPIISTTIGAEGIETEPGQNILIADEAEAFAQAVIQVLNDPDLAQTLGQAGRQTVSEKYHWPVRYADWEKVYQTSQTPKFVE